MRRIISLAYGIALEDMFLRIVGGDDAQLWQQYDIVAKIPEGAAPGTQAAMLRALLEDRFRLKTHRETKPRPVYVVKRAKAKGFGSGLSATELDCDVYIAKQVADARQKGANALPKGDHDDVCRNPSSPFAGGSSYTMTYAGPISQMLARVQQRLDRPLVDETKIEGNVVWRVTFERGVAIDETLISLQDQLGLKFEPTNRPLEVLVVESVQKPTTN